MYVCSVSWSEDFRPHVLWSQLLFPYRIAGLSGTQLKSKDKATLESMLSSELEVYLRVYVHVPSEYLVPRRTEKFLGSPDGLLQVAVSHPVGSSSRKASGLNC
ncbi:rCG56977 [Rattus norvegicus]|uniref:RCG56977 n=1 Tax=Rattus norvegicus TaxID=10116 RepID=A6JDB3_RAT|nr:rCG56977 [Rattus norvegicus]